MIIHNIRMGFATNSSSSHSIVILPKGMELRGEDVEDYEYGWDNFTLTSKEQKRAYFLILLKNAIGRGDSGLLELLQMRKVFEDKIDLSNLNKIFKGDIDHQSVFSFPREFESDKYSTPFILEFFDFIMRDDVAIFGGNDNSDGHPLLQENTNNGIQSISCIVHNYSFSGLSYVCRKDPINDSWVLFNRENGFKIRISFNKTAFEGMENSINPIEEKSSIPELVDFKITDRCERGCEFCYQSSTPNGKYAPLYSTTDHPGLMSIIEEMAKNQVLEVAIGGGEPTEHPEFVEILEAFRRFRIVPNFSTRSLNWLVNTEKAKKILNLIGGFAFSVQTLEEFQMVNTAFLELVKKLGKHERKFSSTIHHVVGSVDAEELRKLVCFYTNAKYDDMAFNGKMVFLGPKTIGRGCQFKFNEVDLLTILDEEKAWRFAIDTSLAKIYQDRLTKIGVDKRFYFTKEGLHSCYIDGVTMTMAPSSFSPNVTNFDPATWINTYQGYTGE